mmetsp:Transcript_24379/g.83336  ORF Transcript_24379/g.83336 Transcript_24379/m.83336 type:complete len:267 (-) Transcript_24379:1023-1823(-)
MPFSSPTRPWSTLTPTSSAASTSSRCTSATPLPSAADCATPTRFQSTFRSRTSNGPAPETPAAISRQAWRCGSYCASLRTRSPSTTMRLSWPRKPATCECPSSRAGARRCSACPPSSTSVPAMSAVAIAPTSESSTVAVPAASASSTRETTRSRATRSTATRSTARRSSKSGRSSSRRRPLTFCRAPPSTFQSSFRQRTATRRGGRTTQSSSSSATTRVSYRIESSASPRPWASRSRRRRRRLKAPRRSTSSSSNPKSSARLRIAR